MSTDRSALTAADEVVEICRNLLRIDTTNFGNNEGKGERRAAEYVMELLTEVGLDPEFYESAPGRSNVVVRLAGEDPTREALVLHGHLDVVPAQADEWSVDPFAGELIDGMLWGRGAVDMKDMIAMMLAVVRQMAREGRKPSRDLIVAFFADEEAGGVYGAEYSIEHKREIFEGASEAISEVGGYSTVINGQRAYLLQTAEKSLSWLKLVADGKAGHGSQLAEDNAVTKLSAAVARIGAHAWPYQMTPTVDALLRGVSDLTGLKYRSDDPALIDELIKAMGPAQRFVATTVRHSVNPTQLNAGYKANVIPRTAEAVVDARFLPGYEQEGMAQLQQLIGADVRIEPIHIGPSVEAPITGNLVDAMSAAILSEDPTAVVLPYMLSAGTDNKSLSKIGIRGYGFVPLQLPPDLDFPSMFHGVDERVPVDALLFGVKVLDQLLATA